MHTTNWPYLAGIFDGEGSICIQDRTLHRGFVKHRDGGSCVIQIAIYNTSLTLMKYLVKTVGGRFHLRPKTPLGRYNQYQWHPSGKKNQERLILGLLPYLVIKRPQAVLALRFLRLGYGCLTERQDLSRQCKLLNQGDPSVETNTPDFPPMKQYSDFPNLPEEGLATMLALSGLMRESELMGDHESAPDVNQGFCATYAAPDLA